jgi:hypothetical protein
LNTAFFPPDRNLAVQEIESEEDRRNTMRALVAACLVAAVVAVGAAAILDNFVQQPVSVAFAEPSARL